MVSKPSKYTLRKLATGSLNKPAQPTKSSLVKTATNNSINNDEEPESIKEISFSEENFGEEYGFKGFIYYATIQDTNWYFTIHSDQPLILFSNNIMEQKYNNKDIYNYSVAYQATYCPVNLNQENPLKSLPFIYSEKATIRNFKTIDFTSLTVEDFNGYPGRIQMDDGRQFFGLNTVNTILLMNNDIEQIKDLIEKFSIQDKIKILEKSLDNIKSSPEDYRHLNSLNKSLFPALNNVQEQIHRLHEHYVMTAQIDEINAQSNEPTPSTSSRKLKF